MSFRRLALFVAPLVLASLAPFTLAQTAVPSRITSSVDNAQRVTIAGTVSPRLKGATDLGALAGSAKLDRMVLVLKHTDAQEQDLQALIAAQHQAGSDQFHKWLTPETFATRFGPSPEDLAKVTTWLQGQGFTAVTPSRGGQRVEFAGTASAVQAAFGTTLHRFSVTTATGAEAHIANASPISIPAALAPVVHSVLSLNDFRTRPLSIQAGKLKRDSQGKLKRETTATDGFGDYAYYVAPGDLRRIYGATSLPSTITGTGVSIAIIGRTQVELSDIQAFHTIFSLPANDPNVILSGPDPGIADGGDQGESSLDLEWAAAIAPNATLNFVIASSTDTTDGIFLASSYAVDNVVSPILSVSYGSCEKDFGPAGNAANYALWQQAAAEGISVFIATGDAGAATCDAGSGNPATAGDTVNGLASTPYNTAVGGTQFAEGAAPNLYWQSTNASDLSSVVGYIPEHVWNDSCDPTLSTGEDNCNYGQSSYNIEGGGGGPSNCALGTVDSSGNVTCTGGWPKPSWQKGTGVPADKVRDIPDVAFNSSPEDDPYMICYGGTCAYTIGSSGQVSISAISLAGGTSVATPIMAGIMALVEQQNGTFQGLANYNIYALANQTGTACSSSSRLDPNQSASCIFNDVTVGNNGTPGLPNFGTSTADFTAAAGYDLATGWGSLNIANLVANWTKGNASSTTTTALTASANSVQHGTPVPVQVKVTSTTGTPTGNIMLETDKYGPATIETLTAGAFSGNVSNLPGGTYNLSARYAGDGTFGASLSATTAVTITPESSATSLVVSTYNGVALVPDTTANYYGTPLYFKGTVVGASGQGTATGTVSLLVDGVLNQSTALTSDGGYLLESESVPVGTHALTVSYAGDNSFNASVSAKSTITVSLGQSVTYISIYGAPAVGTPYTLATTVAGSGPVPPTGTVQFYDNNVAVCGAQPITSTGLQGPDITQAACTYTITVAGKHVLTSTYSGDANYLPVTLTGGFNYTRTITLGNPDTGANPSVTTLSMTSGATVQIGQTARFVIQVAPQSSTVTTLPTGSVYLFDASGNIAYVNPLSNGVLNADLYVYAGGTYTYHAYYPGDSNFGASTSSKTFTFTVPFATPTVSFSASSNYAAPNTQTTLNYRTFPLVANAYVTVDGTGTVTFTDSVNGAAATSLGTFPLVETNGDQGGYSGRFVLPVGSNLITAIYSGNTSFSPAMNTVTVVVGSPDFTMSSTPGSLTIASGTAGTATLSLAPTLAYTGTATLACSSGVPAGATCKVSPAAVTFGAAQTATVTISTLAPSPTTTGMLHGVTNNEELAALSLAGLLIFLLPASRRHRRFLSMALPAVMVLVALGFSGCADSNSSSSTGPTATLLSLKSSGIKVASGTSVTLTASLNGLSGTPTGTVQFYDAGVALGSPVSVSAGTAALQSSALSVGGHIITAVYSGDSKNNASTSGALTQVITGTTTVQITATSGTLVHTVSLPVTLN